MSYGSASLEATIQERFNQWEVSIEESRRSSAATPAPGPRHASRQPVHPLVTEIEPDYLSWFAAERLSRRLLLPLIRILAAEQLSTRPLLGKSALATAVQDSPALVPSRSLVWLDPAVTVTAELANVLKQRQVTWVATNALQRQHLTDFWSLPDQTADAPTTAVSSPAPGRPSRTPGF